MLRIIALAALVQLASSMNAVVLAAIDRLSTVLQVFAATFALSVGGFLIGQRYGLSGAAAGYAAATVVMTPLYVHITARELELGFRPLVSTFLPTAAGIAAMTVTVWAFDALFESHSAVAGLLLVAASLLPYALVVLQLSPDLRRDLKLALTRRPAPGLA